MRIIKITLKPFAGFVDKTISFDTGMNVVLGNNEAGKSTLMKAISMVLFDSTEQTPVAGKKLLKDVLPIGGGDTVSVSLEFEHDGIVYQLIKQWGGSSFSSINKLNEAPVTQPKEVQAKLDGMLKQNRLVWEYVMMAAQAQMSDTHNLLQQNGQVATSLDQILQHAVMNTAGIASEDILSAINVELKEHTDNWDLGNNKPVIGDKQKGSYDNRHIKSIGKILSLDYTLYDLKQKLDEREKYDAALNELVQNIEAKTTEYLEVKKFIDEHKPHIEGYREWGLLNEKINRLEGVEKKLKKDDLKWTEASSQLELLKQNGKRAREEKDAIATELENARKRASGAVILQKKHDIDEKRSQIKQLEALQQPYIFIQPLDLEQIRETQQRLDDENVTFEALKKLQRFKVELTASNNISVDITNSPSPIDKIDLFTATPHSFDAEGSFELKSHELHVKVTASVENLLQCKNNITDLEFELQRIANIYHSDTTKTLLESYRQWSHYETEINNKKRDIKALLGNETYDHLAEKVAAINALPATRSIEDLTQLQEKANDSYNDAVQKYTAQNKIHTDYLKEFITLDNLRQIQLNNLSELLTVRQRFNQITQIPANGLTPINLAVLYDEKNEEEEGLKDSITNMREYKIKLQGEADEMTAQEYQEQIVLLSNEKEQRINDANALIKVRNKLNEIINRAPANPYDGYYNKMRQYLNELTMGKYQEVSIEKAVPNAIIQHNNKRIGIEILSQGTSSLVGIALRLSMADYFLGAQGGFLIFDDPMTDLDEPRQDATANCFSHYVTQNNRQMIVFTCHVLHDSKFAGNKISLEGN